MSESKINEEQRFVASGNPLHGLTFEGPFDDDSAANRWALRHRADEVWWIGTLFLTGIPEAFRTIDKSAERAYFILVGDAADGFTAYGPFGDAPDACTWAEEEYSSATWCVATLNLPHGASSMAAPEDLKRYRVTTKAMVERVYFVSASDEEGAELATANELPQREHTEEENTLSIEPVVLRGEDSEGGSECLKSPPKEG